jgi:glucokinase
MSAEIAVGIDLGGTKIAAGLVTGESEVLSDVRVPTEADKPARHILGNMVGAVRSALEQAGVSPDEVAGVGIGSPAPLDMEKGVILSTGNLPSLHGFPVVDELSREFGKRVVLNNDANCYGLAEARFGAGKGAKVCCGLTLGTGMGGFLVIDGQVFNGPRGAGAEVWCCPYKGDQVEEKVSGRAIARNYKKLTEKVATAKELAAMARDGDADALMAWREFGRDLATPVAWLCNLCDPDVVVLGGSLSRAWDLFHADLMEEASKYINTVNRDAVRVEPGTLGDKAGMMGAAALILTGPRTGA